MLSLCFRSRCATDAYCAAKSADAKSRHWSRSLLIVPWPQSCSDAERAFDRRLITTFLLLPFCLCGDFALRGVEHVRASRTTSSAPHCRRPHAESEGRTRTQRATQPVPVGLTGTFLLFPPAMSSSARGRPSIATGTPFSTEPGTPTAARGSQHRPRDCMPPL